MKATASAPLLLLLCFSAAALAKDYYISPFGNNNNSGTSAQAPFLDLATALAAASSGSTIYAADGFYTGPNNVGQYLIDVTLEGNSINTVFQGDNTLLTLSGTSTLSTLSLKSSSSGTGADVQSVDITIDTVWFSSLGTGIALTPAVGNLTVSSCSFSNTVGKGIYFSSSSIINWDQIVVKDSTFACNSKNVYISAYSQQGFNSFSFIDCDFTESALYLSFTYGPEQMIFDQCTFTNISSSDTPVNVLSRYATSVTDCVFTSCSVTSGSGGSLYVADVTTGGQATLTVSGTTFSGNYAQSYGGALYTSGQSVVVTDSLFVGNSAGSHGGAVSCIPGNNDYATFSFSDSVFAYNSGYYGGALRLEPTEGASVSNCDFGFNYGNYGGAIHYDAYPTLALAVSGSKFVSNVASSDAGGVYADDGNIVQFLDTLFYNNTAQSGGAIAMGTAAVISAQHILAVRNEASVSGGALYVDDGSASFTASAFVGNDAPSGGAIFSEGTSAVNMQKVIFDHNNADASGGAICCYGGGVNISKGAFIGNTSPDGASYSCSNSCGIYTTQTYVPSNSTSGCAPSFVMEEPDVDELMESFASMMALSDKEVHEHYQQYDTSAMLA